MEKHPNESTLLQYLNNEFNEDEMNPIVTHLMDCETCFEKVKSMVYLKKNFSKLWGSMELKELERLQSIVQDSEEQGSSKVENLINQLKNNVMEVIRMKKNRWAWGFAGAGLVLFLVIGLYGSGIFTSNALYSEWHQSGIITEKSDLNNQMTVLELDEMLQKLAGVEATAVASGNLSTENKTLTIQEGANAIAEYFSMNEVDQMAMLGELNQAESLTYKKALNLIDQFAGEIYIANQTSQSVNGNLAVNSAGSLLKDMQITGNLYLMQGIGQGEISLVNVQVNGRVYVLDGGMSSVILDNSKINGEMIVDKADGKVRILTKTESEIASVSLQSGAKLQNDGIANAFKVVTIQNDTPIGSEIQLLGNFGTVNLQSASLQINVENASIALLNVNKDATGSEIKISEKSKVDEMNIEAAVSVNGAGNIGTANIQAGKVELNIKTETVNTNGFEVQGEVDTDTLTPDDELDSNRIFNDDGKPIDGIDYKEAERLFAEKYGTVIKEAQSKNKAIECEGFLFFPDNLFTSFVGNIASKKVYFGELQKQYGLAAPCVITRKEAEKVTSLNEADVDWGKDINVCISNLEGIQYFTNLEKLVVTGGYTTGIGALKNCKNIKELSIHAHCIDLSVLYTLPNLTSLTLRGSGPDDGSMSIAFLKGMPNLQYLNMSCITADDFTPLTALSNLKTLEMETVHYTMKTEENILTSIAKLKNLTTLLLQSMPGTDTTYLSGMTNLKSLTLRNRVKNISGIKSLINLEYLEMTLEYTPVDALDTFHGLSKLKKLKMSEFQVTMTTRDMFNAQVSEMVSNGQILVTEYDAKRAELEHAYLVERYNQLKSTLPNCKFEFQGWDGSQQVPFIP